MRLFTVLIFSIFILGCNHPASADYSRDNQTSHPIENKSIIVSFKPSIQSADDTTSYKVIGVKDGDTFELLIDNSPKVFRFAHVDCPEKKQHFGTGLVSDYNEVKLLDMADIDGSQNCRIIMRFTGGILATNPTQR